MSRIRPRSPNVPSVPSVPSGTRAPRGLSVVSVLSAFLLVLTGLVAPVSLPSVAAAPSGFTPEQLAGPYESDIPPGGTYIPILDGFTTLRDGHPRVIAQNLETVVEINNSATAAERADAIEINDDDRLVSLSYALGDRVGTEFRRLLAAGQLPKVAQLAGGDLARAGLPLGTTLVEKEYWHNPRPFVVAPERIERYDRPGGQLYAGLANSGSYPSGHTSMGYWKGALLAYWLPELGPQIIARAGDIGRSRIVLGVHYSLDVMGGRIMGQEIAAERLGDPGFAPLIRDAGTELRRELTAALGAPLADVFAADPSIGSTADAVRSHRADLTYGFGRVFPDLHSVIPAEWAVLLSSRFPDLTDAQRLAILRRTAIGPGYPLDQPGPDGGRVRVDLAAAYAAAP